MEHRRIQRVETEVDAIEPRLTKWLSQRGELDAIGRQHDLLDAVDGLELTHEPDDAAPHEGLATREADLAHAEAREGPRHAHNFVKGQNILMAQFLNARRRHAILAAQVAAVGQRDAHVLNLAFLPVQHNITP